MILLDLKPPQAGGLGMPQRLQTDARENSDEPATPSVPRLSPRTSARRRARPGPPPHLPSPFAEGSREDVHGRTGHDEPIRLA